MSLENTLERIAVALETIAQARAALMNGITEAVMIPDTKVNIIDYAGIEKDTADRISGADAVHLDREYIKKSLREKGILFKEAARTENLKKLLDAAEAEDCACPPEADGRKNLPEDCTCPPEADGRKNLPEDCTCPPEARETETTNDSIITSCKLCGKVHSNKPLPASTPPAEQTETVTATKEQVRDALVELAGAKGKETALKVLRETGKAEKLADVNPELYGAIVGACKGA